MRLLTETPTHHPKNPVNSENSNHPTQGKGCNPADASWLHPQSPELRSKGVAAPARLSAVGNSLLLWITGRPIPEPII